MSRDIRSLGITGFICITGIPYVDNCVKERAYKQAESACGNSLFIIGIIQSSHLAIAKSKLLFILSIFRTST